MLSFVHHSQYVNHWYCKICYNLRVQETEQHCYVRLEGHSSSGCYTQLNIRTCTAQIVHKLYCNVLMMLWSPSSGKKRKMKVITASSKHCNKVCEPFEQCMSKYRDGITTATTTSRTNFYYILNRKMWMTFT